MKKLILMLLLMFAIFALSACNRNNDTEDLTHQNEQENEAYPTPEPANELTLEELGDIIVTSGKFFNDWWNTTGPFAHSGERIWIPSPGEPEGVGRGFLQLLPASGFESLDDIRNFLLQYHTESWVNAELGEHAIFIEYEGLLYFDDGRAGFPRPDWDTATHILIEQAGGRAVVETTVLWGSWHRLMPGEDIEYAFPWEVTYRFAFANGRIYSPRRYEMYRIAFAIQEQAFESPEETPAPEETPEPPDEDEDENNDDDDEPDNDTTPDEDEIYEPQRSLHTPTTGLLADPNSVVDEIVVSVNTGWDSVNHVIIWETRTLSAVEAHTVHNILTTMSATEVLTPTHLESQQADPRFMLYIRFDDGTEEIIHSVWDGGSFFRFTNTYGPMGDPGYVTGMSDMLLAFLHDFFDIAD